MATPQTAHFVVCHQQNKISDPCDLCHQTGDGVTLKTAFGRKRMRPTKRVLPDILLHRDFKMNHGLEGCTQSGACKSCDTEDECVTCHQLETRIWVHQDNHLRTHSISLRHDPSSCSSCHNPTTFCRDYHSRSGLSLALGAG